jgi:WD40 repeat protein
VSEDNRPFPGLAPFAEDQNWLFFGREEEIRMVTASLTANRLSLLYGDSGAGKSSLLNAGVIPVIRKQSREEAARWGKPTYQVFTFRSWLGDPLAAFQADLRKRLQEEVPGYQPPSSPAGSLREALSEAASFAEHRLLVVLDQCEEYFRYLADGKADSRFLDQFASIWNPGVPVHFLLSVRDDSLGALGRLGDRVPNPFDNYYRLQHLTAEGARAAILEPIAKFNQRSERQAELEKGVADKVIAKILGRPPRDNGEDRLPAAVLQLVLTRWWDREAEKKGNLLLNQKGLDRLGGVETIVGDHFRDSISDALGVSEQRLATLLFVHLVTESGRKLAATDRELAGAVGVPIGTARAVLDPLAKRRVLSIAPNPPRAAPADVCFEFSHDLLAAAALEWRKQRQETEREQAAHERAEREKEEALKAASDASRRALEEQRRRHEEEAHHAELAAAAEKNELVAEKNRALKRGVWALAAVLALALAGLAGALYFWIDARSQSRLASAHQTAALAELALRDDPANLQPAAEQALISLGTERLFDNDLLLRRVAYLLRPVEVKFHAPATVRALAISPDGRFCAAATAGSRIWNIETGEAQVPDWSVPATSVAFSPDSRLVAMGADDHQARVWDIAKNTTRSVLPHGDTVTGVAFSPDGRILATSALRDSPRLWDLRSGKSLTLEHGGMSDNAVAYAPDGERVAFAAGFSDASGATTGSVRVHSGRTGRELYRIPLAAGAVSVAFAPDGRLAAGLANGTAQVWDKGGSRELLRLAHGNAIQTIAFSPDGKSLATAADDQTARIWDAETGQELARLPAAQLFGLAFSPDSQRLAGAGEDLDVRFWETKPMDSQSRITGGAGANLVFFLDDDSLVLDGIASQGPTLNILAAGRPEERIPLSDRARFVAATPDGRVFAAATQDQKLRVWRRGGQPITIPASGVNSINFSEDGRWIAVAGDDQSVRIWDTATGGPEGTLALTSAAFDVAFSPNGKWIASSDAEAVRIWDRGTRSELHRFNQLPGALHLAFSEDSRWLAASGGNDVVVWDLSTWSSREVLAHWASVVGVMFGKNGNLLTAAGDDPAIRIFDTPSGKELTRIRLPLAPAAVSFHPKDGYVLVAGRSARDNSLTLLRERLDTGLIARQVCSLLWPASGRSPSCAPFLRE